MMTPQESATEAMRLLDCNFEPGDRIEFRTFGSFIQQHWCLKQDARSVIITKLSTFGPGTHICVSGCTRLRDGGKTEDVELARCLYADLDKTTVEEARIRWTNAGLPEPTVIVKSGNGVHPYWRLKEPITDLVEFSQRQMALAIRLGSDTAICDAPHVMRLPGFKNWKYATQPMCVVHTATPTNVWSIDQFPLPQPVLPVQAPIAVAPQSMADLSAKGPTMKEPVQRVIEALRACGCNPKQSGTGWSARCPAHADKAPSLSVGTGDDGRALVYCHAGCTVDAVCSAIDMRLADLFADDPNRRNGLAPRTRPSITVTETPRKPAHNGSIGDGDAKTFPTARDAVAELERWRGGDTRSATWTYHDASGEPVGLVVRWDTPTGKDVRPVSKTPAGWIIGGMPTPRPLYSLLKLLATEPGARVYVTEGEKAADAARAVGLVATTSTHGSKSAKESDWSPMAGRDVVILPDHDDAGEGYADDVAKLAKTAGAKSVRVVRLVELWADLPNGGDMADLLEHRGGEVDSIRAEVEALANNADAIKPSAGRSNTVPEFVPFPTAPLPEPIRRFVLAEAKAIGCDASYIALPLLSALASAIGNTRVIQLKRGWCEPAIVWTAIVGESGTHKTPAFKAAMKAIRKAQAKAFKEHEVALAKWKTEDLRYEVELNGWKREAVKKRGGGGAPVDPPEKPTPPIARRYIVSDTTTEALAPILLVNPRGVLLARDELAGWLGSFDRYAKAGKGGTDSANWLSMHNGESLVIDRKTGIPPTINVPSASVSIAGGIQPGILARALGQEHHDSGLLARLLFAMPPRSVKCWTDADMDPATEAAVAAVFDSLFTLMPETNADGDVWPRVVMLTNDGKAAWVRFYNEHANEQANLSGDEAAAWSKLEGYAARFALIFHLIRCVTSDSTLLDKTRVDEASIAAGVALARWFGNEARRVYAILGESDDDRESRRLVEWIERKGGSVTARDLTHGQRAYRGDPDKAERDLTALVDAGIGCWVADNHGPKGGRPAQRFQLVSTVTVTETPANIEKDGSCGDDDTGDTTTDTSDDQEKT